MWRGRATRAIIDLDALAGNIGHLTALIGPGRQLMAVVKGNGYGHGAVPIAVAAVAAGAARLAVATVDEGRQLRDAGIVAPILVLGAIDPAEIETALRHRLTLTVASSRFAEALAACRRRLCITDPVSVHLKVDTGMNRFGTTPRALPDLARHVHSLDGLTIEGTFTHLAAADDADRSFTDHQVRTFAQCVATVRERGINPGLLHVANSAATLRYPDYHFDLVRVGIALYGLRPAPDLRLPSPMRPVLTLTSRVARVLSLKPGDTVSYGRTYQATKPERAALIPIGYADGYRRALSSRGWMALNGQSAPIRGRVCMDQTVVGLPDTAAVQEGTDVVVVGNGTPATDPAPTLDELADLTDTISYELATSLTARVPRLYVRGSKLVALEELASRP